MYNEDLEFFRYNSPTKDKSIFKGIPIEDLEGAKQKVKKLWPNVKFRIIYRGPRFDRYKLHTRKVHATHFSIYTKTARKAK